MSSRAAAAAAEKLEKLTAMPTSQAPTKTVDAEPAPRPPKRLGQC